MELHLFRGNGSELDARRAGDFSSALTALLGRDAPGLSAATISRLKEVWKEQYERWTRRSLAGKNYVYIWVDGVHFGVRLEDVSQFILVIIGATADGKKELLAMSDGYRESEQSWKELLLDLKARGLTNDPMFLSMTFFSVSAK